MLKPDPLSGDNGPNFFGHAWNAATYIVRHPEFGWLAFGGNIKTEDDIVKVTPLDSFRTRVYVASLGLWLTLDSGNFEKVEVNSKTGAVRVGLDAATPFTPTARLHIERPSQGRPGQDRQGQARPGQVNSKAYRPVKALASERDAWIVPLGKEITWVELAPNPYEH
jgi:hypothetical protein